MSAGVNNSRTIDHVNLSYLIMVDGTEHIFTDSMYYNFEEEISRKGKFWNNAKLINGHWDLLYGRAMLVERPACP